MTSQYDVNNPMSHLPVREFFNPNIKVSNVIRFKQTFLMQTNRNNKIG